MPYYLQLNSSGCAKLVFPYQFINFYALITLDLNQFLINFDIEIS